MATTLPAAGRRDGGPAQLGALIGFWATLAIASSAITFVAWPPVIESDWTWQLAGLWAFAFLAGVVHVRVLLRGATEAITLNEIGILPVVLLLEPGVALLVGGTAGLIAEVIITRLHLQKVVFNTSWQVVGLAAAAWCYQGVAGGDFDALPRPLVAAVLASAVYVLVNLAAITSLLSARTRRRLRDTLAEEASASLVLGFGLAQVGIIATVALVKAPWALPLLALPALLYRGRAQARSEGFAGIAAERDRFERTIAGTSDGVVLLDPGDRVEVWNVAMAGITGTDASDAIGCTMDELGLAALLDGLQAVADTTTGEHRAVVGGRSLRVRANRSGTGADRRTVLLVRDVSREAELSRLQEELVSRVSHEIRTPLTTVMGLLDTLVRHWDALPPNRRQELVMVASRGGRRLGRLIANLEGLARIEARGTDAGTPSGQSTRVDRVLADVTSSDERLQPPTVTIEGHPTVRASPEDLRLIVENLIANAELYGAPPVEVVVCRTGDEVTLSVSDHGPGVPAELQAQLFEPFFQADEGGLRRTARGLGLGLAIVRSLAAASGGSVRHDEPPGGGVRFTVTLPADTGQSGPGVVSAGQG